MVKIKNNLVHLDLIRGLAALFVVGGHLRGILFEGAKEVDNLTFFEKLFYFLTGLGHQSVMIFFVLSGFFIIKSILNSDANNSLFWFKYGIDRLTRLWVVLIPALFLTLFFDSLGYHFGSRNLYLGENSFGGIINNDVSANLGLKCFVANVLFLNGITMPTYGSNLALWSLPYEFWFYVLFPLIFLLFQRIYCFSFKGLIFLLLLAVVQIIGIEIVKYFLIWCLGGIPIFIIKKLRTSSRLKRISFNFCSLFIFFTVLIYSRLHSPSFIIDLLLSSVTCLLISVLVINDNYFRFDSYTRIVKLFSNISFTLYAVHLPFIFLVVSFIDKYFLGLKYIGLNIVLYLIILIFTIVFSCFFYYYFERNTTKLKLFVHERFIINKNTSK